MRVSIGINPRKADLHLVPNKNLYSGSKSFEKFFGDINSIEEDLLTVASGIFATDLAIKREEREQNIRNIQFEVEVINFHAFERIKDDLTYALNVLSKDNWEITFHSKEGNSINELEWIKNEGYVLLFSGGLDSMCAAFEFMRDKKPLVLVSHNTLGNHAVEKAQDNVLKLLTDHFDMTVPHFGVRVYGRNKDSYSFPTDGERENSQRTRSFLFVILGALIARRCKFNKVLFMAENGQFAIHLPLNQSRIGPFSTHTADPEFLSRAERILKILLNNDDFIIHNPYLYKTKAEVLSVLADEVFQKVPHSVSCWKASRNVDKLHCGECIPCISRRIACEINGYKFDEFVTDIFNLDLGQLSDDNIGKTNIVDYLEFILKFKDLNDSNKFELFGEFPELFNESFNQDEAIKMYSRMAEQSFTVLENYPQILKYL
nr:7-cyano-7-deazaguanine synthase [uncultured Draconibacterium sp.]